MPSARPLKWGSVVLGLLILFPSFASSSTVCGYMGAIASEIELSFDRCYKEQVKDSRLRMAVGYESCFGAKYEKLNGTVEGPYAKKRSDTQSLLLHMSEAVCSDNEDALNEFILSTDGSVSGGDDVGAGRLNPTELNINQCKDFFDQINQALLSDNFQIASLMKSMEKKLTGLFLDSATRDKIYLVVVNVVKPLAACHQPMTEMKLRLIKKYLKRFLMDQIAPAVPSFSGKTLPVVSHPELFVTYRRAITNQAKEVGFDWNQKRVKGYSVAPEKVVTITHGDQSALSENEKLNIIAMDIHNADKTLSQRDAELRQAVFRGSITDTQANSMTPKQRLSAGLITPEDYRGQVSQEEGHGHFSAPIEISNLWDPHLAIKPKQVNDDLYDRYKIKGFDIDTKIAQLFHE